jgi:quinol-cytochrome oxidoreductase complex cytochrome b subunit
LGAGWAGLLVAAPHAFINTAIAPLQKKPDNAMQLLAFAETSLLLILIILGLLIRRNTKSIIESKGINFLYFTLMFCCILFVLVGWITPVTGALVRYKVPALPLLAACICMLFTFDPARRTFEKLRFYKNEKTK